MQPSSRNPWSRFLADERGSEEEVSRWLVFAFIAVPVIILVIVFKDELMRWLQSGIDRLRSKAPR